MQNDVTIRFEGLPVSEALREDILRHAHKLWQIAPHCNRAMSPSATPSIAISTAIAISSTCTR